MNTLSKKIDGIFAHNGVRAMLGVFAVAGVIQTYSTMRSIYSGSQFQAFFLKEAVVRASYDADVRRKLEVQGVVFKESTRTGETIPLLEFVEVGDPLKIVSNDPSANF